MVPKLGDEGDQGLDEGEPADRSPDLGAHSETHGYESVILDELGEGPLTKIQDVDCFLTSGEPQVPIGGLPPKTF